MLERRMQGSAPATPAASTPSTLDLDARTVEVVASAGSRVRRSFGAPDGSFGAWHEELDLSPQAMDASRFIGGPVLTDHNHKVEGLVGTVEAIRREGGAIVARLRLGASERAETIMQHLRDGILRAVSIGYSVEDWMQAGFAADGLPIWRAARWRPLELSFVPLPADPAALVRMGPENGNVEPRTMELSMHVNKPNGGSAETNDPILAVREAELDRARGIRAAGRALELHDFAERMIEAGVTIEQAQARMAQELAQRSASSPMPAHAHINIVRDGGDMLRAGIVEAVAARLEQRQPEGPGTHYRGWTLPEMARDYLEHGGVNTRGWAPGRVVEQAMQRGAVLTTSDFAGLLVTSANKALTAMFTAAQSPIRSALARPREVQDFRTVHGVSVDAYAPLLEVAEGATVQIGSVGDVAESYSVKAFARQMPLSIQAITNDDLSAFDRVMRSSAEGAAAVEADELVRVLTSGSGAGPTLADGTALFATTRGNLAAAGTTLDATNVAAARQAMRGFRSIATNELVATTPRFLLVGPARELLAEQLLAALYPATTAAVNPFAGQLTLLVEPRISGNPFYLFADPAAFPVLEVAYISGRVAPVVERFEGPDQLGLTMRVSHFFGCGAVGWRGAYRNAGN